MFNYCSFLLGMINTCSYLLFNCIWIVRYFKQNSCDGGLPDPTGPLSVFHHRPSYAQKVKSKLSPLKNLCDMHIHNSLSNVALIIDTITHSGLLYLCIHITCVNIHRTRHYQLEIVSRSIHTYL